MSCDPKCVHTAMIGPDGKKQMISFLGNTKFPIPHTVHSQCDECVKEMIEHGRLMILFNNDFKMVSEYEKLMDEQKKVMGKSK
jgi:hypothetical protein